jgi:hypothetical protein
VVAFDLDADLTHAEDFVLARDGAVSLFYRERVLGKVLAELTALDYAVVEVDAGDWVSRADLHDGLAAKLDFPTYYGRNVAALRDCLADVAKGEYGWSTARTGLAVAIRRFDRFEARQPVEAYDLMDAAARQASYGLLFGHRLLWLLQVDDPGFRPKAVGGFMPPWNRREWLDGRRR